MAVSVVCLLTLLAFLQVQDFYQLALTAFQEGRFQETLSLLDKLSPAEA